MAYTSYNLTQVHFISPPDTTSPTNQLWNYKTSADTLATVMAAGYFDTPLSMAVGDEIMVYASDDVALLRVTADNRAAGGHLVFGRKGLRFIAGQAVTVAAVDTIVTGGGTVIACGASLDSAPVLTCDRATASIGDQAGAPAAGSIYLKTWKPTGAGDATPIAATTFGKTANWWAWVRD